MKILAMILSSGVVTGLVVYAVLQASDALGMLMGDVMTMRIGTFVAVLAAMGFGASGLVLVIRRMFEREDRGLVAQFAARIEKLEQQQRGA